MSRRYREGQAEAKLAAYADISPSELAVLSPQEAFLRLRSGTDGLSEREAEQRLRSIGRNEPPRRRGWQPLASLAGNFVHLLALLLWIAAFLAFVGNLPELGWAILAVILINGVFSFVQEYRASQLLQALQRQVAALARVRREGVVRQLDAALLVPGDVVLLAEGERVPADSRLLTAAGLETDESALTGESSPVAKSPQALIVRQTVAPTLPNTVYAGTLVLRGDAEVIVCATGQRSQFGAIGELTASLEQVAGPLRQEIEGLARVTAVVALLAGLVIWAISTAVMQRPFNEGFIFAIGVIVALVPEGLLPTLSLSLALGVQRMARRNVLVRRLSAIEALGATQIICMDKTGTLTENRMELQHIWLPAAEFAVHAAAGEAAGITCPDASPQQHQLAREILRTAVLASNASIITGPRGEVEVAGDPTEVAIVQAAHALGIDRLGLRRRELPFDSERRLMSTIEEEAEGLMLRSKGAPDAVLQRSGFTALGNALDDEARAQALLQADAYANQGLRVLGVARRSLAAAAGREQAESEMQFLGLITMIDPVRPGAAETVARCRAAGIRVIVITGDHPGTAAEVARRAAIAPAGMVRVLSGSEVDNLTSSGLQTALMEDVVFARATPVQKLNIVTALQKMGNVVAVIGDGVNDAPSLRQADVGVAMGKGGTDIAREAADIVLLDDNFGTIVDAIEEGRAIFANIRSFVTYVFTSNVAELVPFAIFVLAGVPLPLKIVQMLAVDLGTDLLPALALGAEPPEDAVLDEPPRPKGAPLLSRAVFLRTFLLLGPVQALLGLAAYFFVYWSSGWRPGEAMADSGHVYVLATTMTFTGIVTGQIGNVLACRSPRTSLLRIPLTRNPLLLLALTVEILTLFLLLYVPPLQKIFDFTGPGLNDWLFVLLLLPALPLADETHKLIRRWRASHVRSGLS